VYSQVAVFRLARKAVASSIEENGNG